MENGRKMKILIVRYSHGGEYPVVIKNKEGYKKQQPGSYYYGTSFMHQIYIGPINWKIGNFPKIHDARLPTKKERKAIIQNLGLLRMGRNNDKKTTHI